MDLNFKQQIDGTGKDWRQLSCDLFWHMSIIQFKVWIDIVHSVTNKQKEKQKHIFQWESYDYCRVYA